MGVEWSGSVMSGMFHVEHDGTPFFDPAFLGIFGLGSGADVDDIMEMIHDDDAEIAGEILGGRFAVSGERIRVRRDNDEYAVVELYVMCTKSGAFGSVVDVSAFRAEQNALREEKMMIERAARSKSEFIADMDHEVRTAMNAIMGCASMLKNTGLTDKQSEYVSKVDSASRELFSTICNIMDFTKMEVGKLKLDIAPFKLKKTTEAIANLAKARAAQKSVDFVFEYDADPSLELLGDPVRLTQLLINLISNAVQFTHQGQISMKISCVESGDDECTLLFSIADTGIGMSRRQIELLFAPLSSEEVLFSRKYGSTGLGITICKNLVSMMGGTLWCESEVDEGTTFYFKCSFKTESADQAYASNYDFGGLHEQYDDTDSEKNAQVRILVAEDIDINRTIINEYLSIKGYRPDFAFDGRQAVEMVKNSRYDIVFMDIRMPVMDGLESTREIRETGGFENLPIIALTAHAMTGDMEQSMEAGMNGHITKPVDPDLVYKAIRCWVKAREE